MKTRTTRTVWIVLALIPVAVWFFPYDRWRLIHEYKTIEVVARDSRDGAAVPGASVRVSYPWILAIPSPYFEPLTTDGNGRARVQLANAWDRAWVRVAAPGFERSGAAVGRARVEIPASVLKAPEPRAANITVSFFGDEGKPQVVLDADTGDR